MAQLGRASALGAEGCRFKSCHPDTLNVARGVVVALLLVTEPGRVQTPSSNPFWVNLVNGADILFLGTPLGRVEIDPETSRVNVSLFRGIS